ncbi:hypothetical protein [Williamsia sp. M5A3_1d]
MSGPFGATETLTFDPVGASRLVAACSDLAGAVTKQIGQIARLTEVSASGAFGSGGAVDGQLSHIGQLASIATNRLRQLAEEAAQAARAAGLRLIDQDDENQKQIAAALNSPDGRDPAASQRDVLSSGGTDTSQPSLVDQPTTPVRPEGEPAAGTYPLGVAPESIGNFTIDAAAAALDPALPDTLHTLAQQWLQLANSLNSALFTFDNQYSSVLGSKQFSGYAADQMKSALTAFSASGKRVAMEAQVNAAGVAMWAGAVQQSKSQIESMKNSRDVALATLPAEQKLTAVRQMDAMAQMQLQTTWNAPLAALNGALANISDPSSPVAGTPIGIGVFGGGGSGGGAGGAFGSTSSAGGAGGGGGSGGSAASNATKAAQAGAGDPAGTLKRAGSGDPVAASGNAAKNAAAQSGSQNPASAAQSAMSKAGEAGRGLGGASTRSSGLPSSMSEAERKAAAAASAAKAGGAGGGAKGGGGAGGLGGKVGAAGPEGSLSSRSAPGLSAAERAMAGEQAATRATPAGASGSPMGARGAGGQKEEDGKHKAARYLQSSENGEEIVGELPDVAPTVIGGLNLDTTDDTEERKKPPQTE